MNNTEIHFNREFENLVSAFSKNQLSVNKEYLNSFVINGEKYSFKIIKRTTSFSFWLSFFNTEQFKSEGFWDNEYDKIWDYYFEMNGDECFWIQTLHLKTKNADSLKINTADLSVQVLNKYQELNS